MNMIRDRWLLNSRKIDYEALIKTAFLLIQTKRDSAHAKNTKMLDIVQKDFQMMENYIE